jgi:hypothetical protein
MPHCRSTFACVKEEGLALRYPIAVAAVVVLGLVRCGSLCAQPAAYPYYPGPYTYYGAGGGLSPREIVASVRAKGLQPLSRPRREGQGYVLRVLDAANRELQVTVDARTGRILRVAPAGGAGPDPAVPYPPERTEEEEVTNALPAAPPRPGTSSAGRPQAGPPPVSRPAAEPATPPLPRVRPKEATAPALSASAADPLPAPPVPEIEE